MFLKAHATVVFKPYVFISWFKPISNLRKTNFGNFKQSSHSIEARPSCRICPEQILQKGYY